MNESIKNMLLSLSLLPIPLFCFFTGGVSSPLRFAYFPAVILLGTILPPKIVFHAGIGFACGYAGLVLIDRPVGPEEAIVVATELACYLLTAWIASRIARTLAAEKNRYSLAEATFKGLNNELGHRTKNLQAALDALTKAHGRLQDIDRNKTTFLADIAHELRTPLSGIRSYSEILLSYDDLDCATQKEFLEIIQGESLRLTTLVNELLNLIKIETGNVELTTVRVDSCAPINACIKVMTPMVAEKGLQLNVDIPPDIIHIRADMEQLTQVLINLVNNAVKFTRQGGITVGVIRRERFAEFYVADTGEGIFPEEQEKVFQEFYRVMGSVPNRPVGTGLGLAICKKIVEFHGGEISVESCIGKGSTFRFTIPLFSPEMLDLMTDSMQKSKRSHGESRPILVIMRNTVKRMCLRKSLEDLGYKTLGAVSYDKACDLVRSSPVDLIIADVGDGQEGVESMLALAEKDGTPFCMACFHAEPPGIMMMVINAYIWSPFDSYGIQAIFEPAGKGRMKIAIVSGDMEESRRLQMIVGMEGHATALYCGVEDLISSCASFRPDAIIIGSLGEEQVDTVLHGIKGSEAVANVMLLLVLKHPPASHVRLVTAPFQEGRPLLFGLSPLIQEIEGLLLK